jgi:FkbM family methyltransferase
MVTIEQLDPAGSRPALGRECRFATRGEGLANLEYFLEHEGVLYPQPLVAERDGSIRLYPEAPGRYVLHATWQSEGGGSGTTRIEFDVKGEAGSTPQQVAADGTKLWVPTPWDAKTIARHEASALRELRNIIRPGAIVYDIGANVGLFSARFLQWIRDDGWLYAIEPNPVCICFLRANLERTRARNYTIFPVAVSDRRSMCGFTLNYGSSMIGVGADSPVAGKPGHRIQVGGESLDALISTFNLRQPDFIKLDVEGAEASAVAGMMATLEKSRPTFMIELHGRQAATGALGHLAKLGYRYLSCSTAARFTSAEALLDSLPDACVQVIGYSL